MEPDSVIEDKTIELMVSAARWLSVLPAGRRHRGPAHLGVRARPALPLRHSGPAGPLLWLVADASRSRVGPASAPRALPLPAGFRPFSGALPRSYRSLGALLSCHLTLSRREFLFPSLRSSGQARFALPSRTLAEGDGGGRESETSWGCFGLRNLAARGGVVGGSGHPLPKLRLCGYQDRPRRPGMSGVPSRLRLCGIRVLFSGPLWSQASWTKGFFPTLP